jgi:hypothetical protein
MFFTYYIAYLFAYFKYFGNASLDAVEGMTEGSEADWETKRAEIAKELTLERAQQDLSDGWKAWLKENCPGKGRGTKEVIRPAGGVASRVCD